jgi:hypothetical protein
MSCCWLPLCIEDVLFVLLHAVLLLLLLLLCLSLTVSIPSTQEACSIAIRALMIFESIMITVMTILIYRLITTVKWSFMQPIGL